MTEKYKCPFCGRGTRVDRIVEVEGVKQFWFTCMNCKAEGSHEDTLEAARIAWNNRPIEKALVGALEMVSGYFMAEVKFTGRGQNMLDVVDKALAMAEGREIE